MSVYRILDQHVVTEDEYVARAPDIVDHLTQRAEGGVIQDLTLSDGKLLSGALGPQMAGADDIQFTQIGVNKPLTVLIRHVYTGKYPSKGIFGQHGDVAVVSGVKNYSAFDATARAVNFLETGVSARAHFIAPQTFAQGTPVVLYSPAVTTGALTVSFELAVADRFPRELVDHLGSAFQSLAGLPVLLPYAGYLLGAGSVIKLGGGLADALYGSQPPFLRTEVLNFNLPGSPAAKADFRIVCNPALDASKYSYRDGVGLVDQAGVAYQGDEPYLVLSLDGAKNDDLNGFTPSVASAATLQKFFQIKDGAEVAIDSFVGAMGLYSDMRYRQQADKLQAQIDATQDADAKAALEAKRTAVIANIGDDVMKPK